MLHPCPVRSRLAAAAIMLFPAVLPAQKPQTPPQPQPQTTGYDAALARYKQCRERVPFTFHTEGREKLAGTGRPEALQLLIKDYLDSKEYTEHARYTLATLFGRNFDNDASVEPLANLRQACSKKVDVWLWFHALKVQTDRSGDAEALAVVRDNKTAMLRAAAILAIGQARGADLGQAIVDACTDLPKKEADRNVMIGAMSGAIYDNRSRVREDGIRKALLAYIGLLSPQVDLSSTMKVQIARQLMLVLRGPALFLEPEPWLELLERGVVKPPAATNTVVQPRFFGIESDGERFCYVIDLSDSMCKEISPDVRPKGPVTGPRKKPKGVLPDESDLPWHKIKSRFDLAREQLRISLLRLPKDKHFSIVCFGDEAGTLDATKGMVHATKTNIDRAIAELDAIVPGKPEPVKAPDGQLRGGTNMHAGLRLAFGLCDKGHVEEAAYVDPAALTEGCDTIFLLSDGAPSWDDFHIEDKDYGEGHAVINAEYGAAAPRTPRMVYWGPYSAQPWLCEDVTRMNAFRRVRIHCIGIGEANMNLLRALAEIGNGDTFEVGSERRSAPGEPRVRPK